MSPAPAVAYPAFSWDEESAGVSDELRSLVREGRTAIAHFSRPVSRITTADMFAGLAETWKAETQFASSVDDLILHPAYQRIIGLGPNVIPLILADLQESQAHWFWALQALTGATPFSEHSRGDVREMTSAWLRWGRERGMID